MKATKLLLILSLFLCVGCKQLQHYHGHSEHDSTVQVRILRDSVLLTERDSVYIFQTSDSIYKEVWRVRYRDRERLKIDTVFMEKIKCDTVIQVIERSATKGGNTRRWIAFIVAFIIIGVLFAAWWFFRKRL